MTDTRLLSQSQFCDVLSSLRPHDVANKIAGHHLAQRARIAELESRLNEIDAGAKADADDLEKMRDGTKLTRAGIVQVVVYQQQEIRELKDHIAAITAERDRLRADVERLRTLVSQQITDECDDDTAIRTLAKSVCPPSRVYGDSFHVPGVVEIAEMLTAEVNRLRAEKSDAEKIVDIIRELIDRQCIEDAQVVISHDEENHRWHINPATVSDDWLDGDTLLSALEAAKGTDHD